MASDPFGLRSAPPINVPGLQPPGLAPLTPEELRQASLTAGVNVNSLGQPTQLMPPGLAPPGLGGPLGIQPPGLGPPSPGLQPPGLAYPAGAIQYYPLGLGLLFGSTPPGFPPGGGLPDLPPGSGGSWFNLPPHPSDLPRTGVVPVLGSNGLPMPFLPPGGIPPMPPRVPPGFPPGGGLPDLPLESGSGWFNLPRPGTVLPPTPVRPPLPPLPGGLPPLGGTLSASAGAIVQMMALNASAQLTQLELDRLNSITNLLSAVGAKGAAAQNVVDLLQQQQELLQQQAQDLWQDEQDLNLLHALMQQQIQQNAMDLQQQAQRQAQLQQQLQQVQATPTPYLWASIVQSAINAGGLAMALSPFGQATPNPFGQPQGFGFPIGSGIAQGAEGGMSPPPPPAPPK